MLATWASVVSETLREKQCLSKHSSAALADCDKQSDAGENYVTVDISEVTPDSLL